MSTTRTTRHDKDKYNELLQIDYVGDKIAQQLYSNGYTTLADFVDVSARDVCDDVDILDYHDAIQIIKQADPDSYTLSIKGD